MSPDLVWRKSSRSAGNGGACVELTWRKSSRSGGNGGQCVELASIGAVRDSKNPDGPLLRVELSDLLEFVKRQR